MADTKDPNEDVQIKDPETERTMTVARSALPFFTEQGWQELDKAGRVKAGQTTKE